MSMSEQDINEIKRWLMKGDRTKIMRETGLSRDTVYKSLQKASKVKNVTVISKAIEIAIENKAKVMHKMTSLKQL